MLGSIRLRQPFLQTPTLPFPPLDGAVLNLVPSLRRTIDATACLFQTGAEVRFRSTGGSEGVSVVGGGSANFRTWREVEVIIAERSERRAESWECRRFWWRAVVRGEVVVEAAKLLMLVSWLVVLGT